MPKDLAALLVEDGAVPADVVERALARQREAGGALDTALLEEGALPEDALAAYLARAAELPAAPASAWQAADARARRVFPSRVAERHGLAPFSLEGRELALVATYPVDLGLLDEISFMLSLHLTAHVGPEWRVRELIHRIYGSPLPPRLAALASSEGAATQPAEAPAPEAPPEARPPPSAAGFPARDDDESMEPLAAALALALESFDIDVEEPPPDAAPGAGAGAQGGAEASPEPEPEEELEPEPEEPPRALDRSAPPRWSLQDARAAVGDVRHRDEVVLTALRYARDFFEFAAMFAVTRDAVAGHDALGMEEARDRVRTVAIWASDPGIFKTVIETQSPYLGPVAPGAAGTDAVLHGLARTPRTVLVYPIVLRDRVVCILFADNGDAPVSPRRLGDLLLFLSTVGGTFERIIRDRKKRRRRKPRALAPAPEPAAPDVHVEATPAAAAAADPVPEPPAEAAPVPEPKPEPPPDAPPPLAKPQPAAGGTALLWPAAREPGEDQPLADWADAVLPAHEAPAEPEPVRGAPAAPAESLAALEDQFFAAGEGGEEAAPQPGDRKPETGDRSRKPDPQPQPEPRPQLAAQAKPDLTPPPVAPPPDRATLAALADRALDPDLALAAAACAALANRRRDPAVRQVAEKLRRALLSGLSVRAARAAEAVGALRDADSIPLLIQVLETSDPPTARAAADALAAITLQRLGTDARRWLAWWKENRGRGRAEWLFSGLTSADRDVRVAASVELSHAAPPPVAYTADMPASDREKAARQWAGWWARSGHVL